MRPHFVEARRHQKMSKSRVWGNRNPHQDRDPAGMAKSIKWISVLPGWILLFEKSNPLTIHIVLYWKYSVEKKKEIKLNIYLFEIKTMLKKEY